MNFTVTDEYDEAVQSFITRENNHMPYQAQHYNWHPFLRALSEGNVAAGGVNRIRFGTRRDAIQVAMMQRDDPPPVPVPRVPKAPGTGSWDYTWYIPEWSHPEYDPSVVVNFMGEVRHLSNRDPISRLYPALRAADAVRGPTEWAKHFGIHPDETGGRSRLSPTLSATRDPFDHFANQINMLSEESRRRVFQASREAAYKAGGPIPTDPRYVDPNVLEAILNEHGVLSGRVVREKLQQVLNRPGKHSDITNLETFIQGLHDEAPDTYRFHQQFLDNALHDQDYQRFIFNNLTSDEIVTNNFFNTNGNFICDLDNPIHPILTRHHWAESDWKGAIRREPRYLYSMDGGRQEWDVITNDTIWNALQPALKLVSLIITNEHPMLKILSDMTNRQQIPAERDNRFAPRTPYLWSFHPEPAEGLANTPPGIPELAASGFNWTIETWEALENCIEFDIVSGYIEIHDNASNLTRIRENPSFGYGTTRSTHAGPDSRIHVTLSAELLWPLLVPQYTGSEKVTTSFQIASTIIHELGHAINQAHTLITNHPEYGEWRGYDPLTRERLLRMGDELWDPKIANAEPYFKDAGVNECGFELEKAIWGFPVFNLLQHANLNYSRQLLTVPFIACHTAWPYAERPELEDTSAIKGTSFPISDYSTPIPVEYMARFFTKKFWEKHFVNYGFEALKLIPKNTTFKTLMVPERFDDVRGRSTFGMYEWHFLNFVTTALVHNEFTILSEYVQRSMWMAMLPGVYVDRWTKEMKKWETSWMADLDKSVEDMKQQLVEARSVAFTCVELDQGLTRRWQEYAVGVQGAGGIPLGLEDYTMDMKIRLTETFRHGGHLMRLYLNLYRKFMDEIRYMQRMIFDCFNLDPDSRQRLDGYGTGVTRGWQNIQAVKAAYTRMVQQREKVRWFWGTINGVSNMNQLVALKSHYQEWAAKFDYCWKLFDELIKMMDDPPPPNSDDRSWKKRFSTVPSSYWKGSTDRIQVLAHKEYLRADPRIRSVIDDCMRIIRTRGNQALLTEPFEVPNVNTVAEAMKTANAPEPTQPPRNIFSWQPPPAGQQSGGASQPPPALQGASTSAGGSASTGLVFGQIGQIGSASQLGALPPRRDANLPAGGSNTGFNTWAAKGGFASSSQGGQQISFGQGGAIAVPPASTRFTRYGPGHLFPAPGADPDTLTSDVQHFEEVRPLEPWEFVTGDPRMYESNESPRNVMPAFNEEGDMPSRARQVVVAGLSPSASEVNSPPAANSPPADSPPTYAPTPYISPQYLPEAKSPADGSNYGDPYQPGPPIFSDEIFQQDPDDFIFNMLQDVDFEAAGAAGSTSWNFAPNDQSSP